MERRHTNLDRASELIELERAQIGHEIHDGLLPLIFASSAAVNSLLEGPSDETTRSDPEQTLAKLRQVSQWLREALDSGRHLLTGVYPPELSDTTWSRAARDAVDRLFADCPAKINWQLDPAVDATSPPVSLAVYRIVVEAVRNAVAHGKATEVKIIGEKVGDGLRLVIEDNGIGFDPQKIPADRFGIRSMIGRASLVGGSLVLDSAMGAGTKISVSVPSGADA